MWGVNFFYRDIIKPPYQISPKRKKELKIPKLKWLLEFQSLEMGILAKKKKEKKRKQNIKQSIFWNAPCRLEEGKNTLNNMTSNYSKYLKIIIYWILAIKFWQLLW
jgi:hypothetical protein